MRNYILNTDEGLIVDNINLGHISPRSFISRLALNNFKSISSMTKTVNKLTNITYLEPLFINESLLLVPLAGLRSKDCFYFNYYSLKEYFVNGDISITILFKDKSIITVIITEYRIKKAIKRVETLISKVIELEKE